MGDVTQILNAIGAGDRQAAEELLPLVYEELRQLAANRLAQEQPGQTLQATALVHEAWLRLVGDANPRFEGRGHFFAAAAEAMRRILIDRAREKLALKRGARAEHLQLENLEIAAEANDDTLLAVDEALTKLAAHDPDSAEFIKLRFYVGLTNDEAAQALGIPERTARRHWSFARAWLLRELRRQSAA
ncbi:MAG TPA: sigma-70 family RNA polymerase sigma factor [Verrucomicrobiae bacterium]|nr:sigma-70 family RNA polymerase sigma factor [Verrucomicrobiae bacterium]